MRPARRLLAIGTAAAVLGLQPAAAAAPADKPQRIMTMNMCADLMVLQLVPKSRIASVTYLAKAGSDVLFPGADTGIAINHGTLEDIINLKPDLIVAGDFSTPMTRRMARKVGARLVELKSATTFADVRANLRALGAEVGEPARAETLVARMDATLAGLRPPRPRSRSRVVVWSGGATVPGATP
jgi:iron complex transport system substrate-binding protein